METKYLSIFQSINQSIRDAIGCRNFQKKKKKMDRWMDVLCAYPLSNCGLPMFVYGSVDEWDGKGGGVGVGGEIRERVSVCEKGGGEGRDRANGPVPI
jgi:hypothetical protein